MTKSFNLGPENYEVFCDAEIVWMGAAIQTPHVTYIPYATEDGQVGFVLRGPQGDRQEFIYLNPSNEAGDGVPDVFVYQGLSGDPGADHAAHCYPAGRAGEPVVRAQARTTQGKFSAAMLRLANDRGLDLVVEADHANTGHYSFQPRDGFEPALRFPFNFQHGRSSFNNLRDLGPLGRGPRGGAWSSVRGGEHDLLVARIRDVLDRRLETLERVWTVVGVYGDGRHDEGRFAESFSAPTAEEAEDLAQEWARGQGEDEPDITIAGVLAGSIDVAL